MYLFQQVVSGKRKGAFNKISDRKEQQDWLRSQARKMRSASFGKIMDNAEPFKRIQDLSQNSIGKLYTFMYDPKWKAKLPYYDIYPLIFPIEFYGDSMLGINLHYLPPVLRANLMDALWKTANNDALNKTTKLQISYKILSNSAQFGPFKPCVKKYLFSHVRSPFVYVSPDEWDIALMLPTAKFQKASEQKVWADSRGKI